jgi:hypothetical protein
MRTRKSVTGHIHFSMIALLENRQGIGDQLTTAYPTAALTPAMAWLGNDRLPAPRVVVTREALHPDRFTVNIDDGAGDSATPLTRWYAIWSRLRDEWKFTILRAEKNSRGAAISTQKVYSLDEPLSALVVTPIDRFGNEGERVIVGAQVLAGAP